LKTSKVKMFNYSDTNKIGIFLVLAGVICYFLSLVLIFDRSLAIIGNLSFIVGIYCLIGFVGTVGFFTKKGKLKGSVFFFGGFLVILMGLAIIGIPLQLYGLFVMFRSFLPYLFEWLMSMPGVGPALSLLTRKQQMVPEIL